MTLSSRPRRTLPEGLSYGLYSWRNVHDQPNPSHIFSTEGWSVRPVREDVENQQVRWRYSSPEIEFDCIGDGYYSTREVIPSVWTIILVGLVPGPRGTPRLSRECRPLIEKHCHNLKRALPYWGTTRELPYLPKVRIDDPFWPIRL